MKYVSPIIEKSGQSLNLELMLDINDRSTYEDEIKGKNNTLTNCAGDCRMTTNIITMNRQIIMEEMDTEIAIKALQNKGCDTSDITGSRGEKKTKILELLEKDEFFYLPSFLNELQRHELDLGLLYKRLNICQEVFSSKIERKVLCEGCINISNHTDELQTLEMIVYLIRKGKDAMLHFVDALHQCEIDEYKLVLKE
ncbi:unnamed protein product [Mytilus edulis]|uniref:Uncharacterized protein n=1 Tax=Mytilus edulis TaxID=6550 RepID=A0A8S3VFL7_MYTED|nr:unnamed protein product [Mytilus edulis]